MQRRFSLIALVVLVVVCGLIVARFVRSPMGLRRAQLEEELAAIEPETAEFCTSGDVDASALQRAIAAKPGLWRPLIAAPAAPKAGPDLAKRLADVVVTRHQMGAGDTLKVKVLTGKADRRGSWLGKGDAVNGVKIKEIADAHVVFCVTEDGQEYAHTLPRQ